MPTTARKAVYAAAVTAFALALAEAGARLVPEAERPTLDSVAFAQADAPELYESDPRRFWRLRPGLDVGFSGTRVRTNSLGLRGAEPRDPRILCLGDSVTFGYLVEQAESYPARLQAGLGVETLAAGVPGYTSHQGRALLEELLGRFAPAVVVVSFGYNDGVRFPFSDREAAQGGRARLRDALGRSAFLRRVGRLLGEGRAVAAARALLEARARSRAAFPPGDPLAARRWRDGEAAIRARMAGFPERVSLEDYRDNLRAMIALVKQRGAVPILLAPPFAVNSLEPYFAASARRVPVSAYRAVMQEVAREEGVAFVRVPPLEERPDQPDRFLFVTRRLGEAEREGFRLLELDPRRRRELGLDPILASRTDLAHPSPAGHARIAAALAEALALKGLFPPR